MGATKKPTTIAPSKRGPGQDSKSSITEVRSHVVTVPSEAKSPTSPSTTLAETAFFSNSGFLADLRLRTHAYLSEK
ncbi:hypothetical protein ANCDUO_02314 [Ancylostoma duodenale]|uniref:Uncharacterized protein n=1 Tax=Ancylostoma duodenale TaxID=51022 RepID=A0A0C2DC10_9BILA|nr:hypothetical protein ANCDUO_02314 [Ancylostoma duodenale]